MTQIPISIAIYFNPFNKKWTVLVFNPTFDEKLKALVLNKNYKFYDTLEKARSEAIKTAKTLSNKNYKVVVIEGQDNKPNVIWRSDQNE
jgi:hypothetical protein